jgi:hypothetical protein
MHSSLLLRWFPTRIFILPLVLSNCLALICTAPAKAASPSSGMIVIGFVGGFVHQNNAVHQEVKLATHLRDEYPSGVEAEIFENRQGRQAHESVLQLLDTDHDGTLSDEEKRTARIVLYGHSWGASEAVTLARSLQKDGIPVLLTIQVDSVSKRGENDRLIPANVAQAVNFYQRNGLLHGQKEILAVDRLRTQILGNFKLDYSTTQVNTAGYPWYAKIFMKPHIEIESDPSVWNRIESLIRSKVGAPATAAAR